MSKSVTVLELSKWLLKLIEQGDGDKEVTLSVNYNNCDHMQDLKALHNYEGIDWIILDGDEIE